MRGILSPSLRLVALAAGAVLSAPVATAATQDVLHVDYLESTGLPSSKVLDVRGSPSGLPWFGMRAGLFEFDGSEWTRVLTNVLAPNREVRFVRFAPRGEAWILCGDGTLVSSADGFPVPNPRLPAVEQAGFLHDFDIDVGPAGVRAAVVTSLSGLLVWEAGEWSSAELTPSAEDPIVVEACFGQLFVGTGDGLRVLGAASPDWEADLPEGTVRGLTAQRDEDGEVLWIVGDGWVGRVGSTGSFELIADGLPRIETPDPSPLCLVADGLGGVLFGNSLRLYHIDARSRVARPLGSDAGMAFDGVNALAPGAEGLVWAASDLGAAKLIRSDVGTLAARHGLFDDEVSAVARLADGRVVLGHYGGLTLDAAGVRTALPFAEVDPQHPAASRVMDLAASPDGRLFIAAAGFGVGVFDGGAEVAWHPVPPVLGGWANSIEIDGQGRTWVGTPRGLARFDAGAFERVAGLPDGLFVRRIEATSTGSLFLATTRGLWTDAGGAWTGLCSDGAIACVEHFFTCHEDERGQVWAGSTDGLWRVEHGRLSRAAPEFTSPVYALASDARERLWLGTNRGFAYLDGARFVGLDWMAGLTGTESNRAAALADDSGRIWLGTTKGVTVFEPTFDVPATPPTVELLDVRADGVLLGGAGPLQLDSTQSRLTFRVRARAPWFDGGIEYRYRINNGSWRTTLGPSVLETHYAGLPPGRHEFQIQARHPGTVFGPLASAPAVRVLGPLWTRPWFLVVLSLVSAVLAVGVHHVFSLRRSAVQLEREVAARTRDLEASVVELAKTDRLRTLGVLGGGIAHDMRNVLTVLSGNVSLLEEFRVPSTNERAIFEALGIALERATQLSSQLQTFATGGAPLTRSTSLEAVVSESGRLALSGSRVAFETTFDDDLLAADVDPAQIRQVFENILINARQCQADGGWIRVEGCNIRVAEGDASSGAAGAQPGRYVQLTISDGGPGIPADVLRNIFEPFFTTKKTGSGLGLATARSIVARHGGGLTVDSEVGVGTTFRILLPVTEDEPVALAGPVLAPSVARGRRVLVVDDEPQIQKLVAMMFARLGFSHEGAENGDAARRLLSAAKQRGSSFDLVILDLTIPGDRSAPETLARLREIEPDLRAIAISGYSEDAILARHADFGFDGAVAKPFRLDDLRHALADLPTQRRTESAG